MRLVPTECVRDNTFLAKTIYDDYGRPLLKKGTLLTERILKKLQQLQIYSIYIIDKYSDNEIEDIIKPELRQKCIKSVKDSFHYVEKFYNDEVYSSLTAPKKNKLLKVQQNIIRDMQSIAEDLVENILSNKNILVNLVDIKTLDNYTYQHSVNVTIISIILGLALGLNKKSLSELALGALLHDIGKTFVPKEILLKPSPLTPEEFEYIKRHPYDGYNYINLSPCVPTASKLIILQHHERCNGTGYPDGLTTNDINMLANIVSIADVYDALTSKRPYKEPMCPNDAFEYILSNTDVMFKFDLVMAFSKVIVPYPEGTLVRLSTGDIAVVENCTTPYPLRPTVRIVKSNNKLNEGSVVDLRNALSVVISNIEY